jgi:hypothetical protein
MNKHTDPGVVREELTLFKQMLHKFLDQGLSLSSSVQHANALYHHHTPKEDTICLGITQVLQERDIQNVFARFDAESGMIEVIESIPWMRKRSPDDER